MKTEFNKFISLWNQNVNEAKAIVVARQSMQIKIAEYALEVCEIDWGGVHSKYSDKFTMKRFAEEIGLNARTLSTYINIKKNVFDKLDQNLQTKASYTIMHHVARTVDRSTTKKILRQKVKNELSFAAVDRKLISYTKALRSLCHLFEKGEPQIDGSKTVLEEVKYYATTLKELVDQHIPEVKPFNHNVISNYSAKHLSANEALGTIKTDRPNLNKLETTIVSPDGLSEVQLRTKDLKVLKLLKQSKKALGPTEIGMRVENLSRSNASAWALRSIRKMMEVGLLERTKEGRYKVANHVK